MFITVTPAHTLTKTKVNVDHIIFFKDSISEDAPGGTDIIMSVRMSDRNQVEITVLDTPVKIKKKIKKATHGM